MKNFKWIFNEAVILFLWYPSFPTSSPLYPRMDDTDFFGDALEEEEMPREPVASIQSQASSSKHISLTAPVTRSIPEAVMARTVATFGSFPPSKNVVETITIYLSTRSHNPHFAYVFMETVNKWLTRYKRAHYSVMEQCHIPEWCLHLASAHSNNPQVLKMALLTLGLLIKYGNKETVDALNKNDQMSIFLDAMSVTYAGFTDITDEISSLKAAIEKANGNSGGGCIVM